MSISLYKHRLTGYGRKTQGRKTEEQFLDFMSVRPKGQQKNRKLSPPLPPLPRNPFLRVTKRAEFDVSLLEKKPNPFFE